MNFFFSIILFCLGIVSSEAAYIKFFMKDGKTYLESTEKLDRYLYKIANREIYPQLTDSIHCNGFTGIPYRDAWLYKIVSGPVTLFRYQPAFSHTKFDFMQVDTGMIISYHLDSLKKALANSNKDYFKNFSPAEAAIAFNFDQNQKSQPQDLQSLNLTGQEDLETVIAQRVDPFVMKNYVNKSVSLRDLLQDKPEAREFSHDPVRALYLYNGLDSIQKNQPWNGKRRQRFSFTLKPLAYPSLNLIWPDEPSPRPVAAIRVKVKDHFGVLYEPILIRGNGGGFGMSGGLILLEEPRSFFGSQLAAKVDLLVMPSIPLEFRYMGQYIFNLWSGEFWFLGAGVEAGWGAKEFKATPFGNDIFKVKHGVFGHLLLDIGFSI